MRMQRRGSQWDSCGRARHTWQQPTAPQLGLEGTSPLPHTLTLPTPAPAPTSGPPAAARQQACQRAVDVSPTEAAVGARLCQLVGEGARAAIARKGSFVLAVPGAPTAAAAHANVHA
jgi:hypothetical protein